MKMLILDSFFHFFAPYLPILFLLCSTALQNFNLFALFIFAIPSSDAVVIIIHFVASLALCLVEHDGRIDIEAVLDLRLGHGCRLKFNALEELI
jgi:hypothetical protein